MQKKVYFIGIGGIGISALARYYKEIGYEVYGSDKTDSQLIQTLQSEGINIKIGEYPEIINNSFEKVIYTEAVPKTNSEYKKALELNINIKTYPQALGEIANSKKLITISGTHGKSTTTSLASILLKNSNENFTSIVGTLLKEFDGKNFYHRNNNINNDEYFIIEACEYNRSFLNYKPSVAIITNIEVDHLDYFKDEEDYLSAYKELINNIVQNGFVILNGQEENSKKLIGIRQDINYIIVQNNYFDFNGQQIKFPILDIKIPGDHIYYDSKLVYILGFMLGINNLDINKSFSEYKGVWRRMEQIGQTENGNLLMSDYGHHPTEIKLTLEAIKKANIDKQILTVFQPHQYSRTLELLEDFKKSFKYTDKLIIPNIYESRDSEKDKQKINTDILLEKINHNNKINGNGLENTLKLIEEFDKENSNSIIILMGAGDIDNLRYKIKTA